MTGLTVLDVFISLVFIYLLYSLFAMTVIEFITSSFGSRSKNLLTGIDRLLADDHQSSSWNHTVLNLFYSFSTNSLTNFFYQHPSIKYLGHKGINTKPSYISADRFSSTLVDILKKGLHEDTVDNISAALGEKLPFDIRGLKSRIETLKTDLEQLKKKPNVEEFEIDTTQEELDFLNADLEKRMVNFEEFLLEKVNIGPDTKYQLRSLWKEAANDVDKFQALINHWYEEQMDRITGWYKRKVTFLTFLVGLVIAVMFNVDTILLVQDLSKNETMRTLLVERAQEFVANNPNGIPETLSSDQKDYLEKLKTDMDEYTSVLSSNKFDNQEGDKYPPIFGWLISAFAFSLGAPFWFDMLNKMMKVRPSIQIPAKTNGDSKNSDEVIIKAVG